MEFHAHKMSQSMFCWALHSLRPAGKPASTPAAHMNMFLSERSGRVRLMRKMAIPICAKFMGT